MCDILYVREKQRNTATVAYHGNGAYRPGKSGAIQKLPDTKPAAWASAGRRGGACGKSEIQNTKGA